MDWFNERKYRVSIYSYKSLIIANHMLVLSNCVLFGDGFLLHRPLGKFITIAYRSGSCFIHLYVSPPQDIHGSQIV